MFVKTIDRELTETGLFCEYFGNVVAREANLMTPEPALVAIDLDTAHMINESSAAKAVGKRVPPGVAVGAELIRPAVHPARASSLSPEQLHEAAAIYVYDMLAHHVDRRVSNPNLLMLRGHFVTIDFDMVFPFLWPLAPAIEPWEVSKLRFPEAHYFAEVLRGARSLDWDSVLESTLAVDVERLRGTYAEMPEAWHGYADRVLSHIAAVIEHRHQFRWEVLRTVS
jgi:hypothetical protein